jgi:hypothetical protein
MRQESGMAIAGSAGISGGDDQYIPPVRVKRKGLARGQPFSANFAGRERPAYT